MKALVISGGGSKGAFAGGFAAHLIQDLGINYDLFVGTSTGALINPLLALGDLTKLKDVYTSVTQNEVYDICPFKVKELPNGEIKSKINHFNTLRMFLKGKQTFGETKKLRKTIGKILSYEDFLKIKHSGKKVICTVANLTKSRVEQKYLADCNYEDFLDWMWASASFVPFMSVVEKDGYEYADGGFGNYIPIEEAINVGATEIDVIVLIPQHREIQHPRSKNAFDIMTKTMGFMMDQIAYDDIYLGHLESIYNEKVKVRFHFTPRLLTAHSFYFKPKLMEEWWDEGYSFAIERMKELAK